MKKISVYLTITLFCLLILPSTTLARPSTKNQNWPVDKVAQLSLKQLADRNYYQRMLKGGIITASGGGLVLLGFVLDENARPPLLATGGVVIGIGGLIMLLPTTAEREFSKVENTLNPLEKEYIALESMNYLAENARKNRIINGIAFIGSGIYYLLYKPELQIISSYNDSYSIYPGLLMIANWLYYLLSPSYVEKLNQNVQEIKRSVKP